MASKIQILTFDDVKSQGENFLWPKDGSMMLMPHATWQMIESNPDHPPEIPVAACLTLDDRRVATVTFANQAIQFGRKEYPCLWLHALESHPKVRSAGLGGMFLKQVLRALGNHNTLFASYGATPVAVRLFKALRMVDVGLVPRYVLPIGASAIVRRYVPTRLFRGLATVVLKFGLHAYTRYLLSHLRHSAKKFQLVEKDCFEGWELHSSLPEDKYGLKRTEKILNWKLAFARSITGVKTKVYYVIDGDGAQVAHMMLRVATHEKVGSQGFRDARMCRVLDLITNGTNETIAATFYFLLRLCAEERCDFLEIITTDNAVRRICESLHFIQSSGYNFLITRQNDLPEECFAIQSWFLNMMESDPAFF